MTGLTRLRWWEIPELLPLEQEAFGPEAWSETLLWSELAQTGSRHYVIRRDDVGAVAGYAGLWAYDDEAYVQNVVVRADLRGSGIGSQLLTELLAEAERRGARTVGLEVRATAEGAQRLYRRFGFEPVGRRRGYYQPSGTDAVVMVRRAA